MVRILLVTFLLFSLCSSASSQPSNQSVATAQEPIPKTIFKGLVLDPEGKAIAGANVFSGLDSTVTGPPGRFLLELSVPDTGGIFPAVIKANGYVTKGVLVKLVPGDTTSKNIMLVPTTYRTIVGVRFKPKSVRIETLGRIDEISRFLKECPEVAVEIQGHCFEWNSKQKNLSISQLRAEAVRRAIIEKGVIDPSRIVAVGYGSTRPIPGDKHPVPRKYCTRIELRSLP